MCSRNLVGGQCRKHLHNSNYDVRSPNGTRESKQPRRKEQHDASQGINPQMGRH